MASYTSTGGTPSSGSPTIGTIGGGGGIPFKGNTHETANVWTKNFETPLQAKLAAATTPEEVIQIYQQYLQDAQAFLNDPRASLAGSETVINQSLSNPKLLGTFDQVWQKVGGPDKYGMPSLTSDFLGLGKVGAKIQKALDKLGININIGGGNTGGNTGGTTTTSDGTTQGTGTPQQQANPYLDLLKLLLPAGLDVASGLITNSAIKDAADLQSKATKYAVATQAKSANDALGFQSQMYNQNRQDLAPWMTVGGSAMTRLGDLMGLKRQAQAPSMVQAPQFTMLQTDANGNPVQPAPQAATPGTPAPNASQAYRPPMDYDQLARLYQGGR